MKFAHSYIAHRIMATKRMNSQVVYLKIKKKQQVKRRIRLEMNLYTCTEWA